MINPHQINLAGAHFVAAKLALLGYEFVITQPVRGSYRVRLQNMAGDKVELRPKVRRSGTWHESIDYRAEDDATYVVFVDLADGGPDYYVVPPSWLERDVQLRHAQYLAEHDGHRAVNDESKHHAIELGHVKSWRDRWDLVAGTPVAAEVIG